MRSLDRKLFRNLRSMKGQVAAIALIVTCAVATWVSSLVTWDGLRLSREAYYEAYRVAHVFAPVKKAPEYARERLEAVDGVRRVRSRISFEVSLDLPDVPEPCVGRALSLPDEEQLAINGIHLTAGGWFTGDGNRQVILGDRFATAHGLEIGDRIHAVLNNSREALTVVGTALSPEYIYMIRGAGEVLPDPEHFTAMWVSRTFAEAAFDYEDSANEFCARLTRDASVDDVIAEFDRILDRYGSLGAYGIRDHASDRYLMNEIEGLRGTATMIPTIFLGVAAFVLHMLLGRMVRSQRTQIAVFRAYGYTTREITTHYLKFAVLTAMIGCVAGTLVGAFFAGSMLETYQEFYQFPFLRFSLTPEVVLSGAGVSLVFAVLGALSAARRAARVDPAEGMRPEPPGVFRRTFIERIGPVWRRLGFVWRMVIRNVVRARLRTVTTIFGVSMSASILILAFFMDDSIRALMDFQYRHVELQDVRVTFFEEEGRRALHELRRIPGVRVVEPELIVPVTIASGHRERRIGIFGLPKDGVLHGLVDSEGRKVPRPERGLVMSAKLAELLDVAPGDLVEARVLTGKKQVFSMPVERTIDDYVGLSAWADIDELSHRIDEELALNAALLEIDSDHQAALTRTLADIPAVTSVTFTEQSRRIFEDTLAEFMGVMIGVLAVFAGIISFGVIYNASRITLAERERSLASMRILGFTQSEVLRVLSRENMLLAFLSVPFGLGVGVSFCYLLVELYDTDLFRFPLALSSATLFKTALGILLFAALANLAVSRRVRRLDIVEALKARE